MPLTVLRCWPSAEVWRRSSRFVCVATTPNRRDPRPGGDPDGLARKARASAREGGLQLGRDLGHRRARAAPDADHVEEPVDLVGEPPKLDRHPRLGQLARVGLALVPQGVEPRGDDVRRCETIGRTKNRDDSAIICGRVATDSCFPRRG